VQLAAEMKNLIHASVQTGYGHAVRDIRDGKVQGLGPTDEGS
jgi:hypothetical protein